MIHEVEIGHNNYSNASFATYKVRTDDKVDHVEVEMLRNNKIPGLLNFSSTQSNDKVTFLYDVTSKTSLTLFLQDRVTREKLFSILESIGKSLMNSDEYMLDMEHYVLNNDHIFIDVSTYQTDLLFLPIINSKYPHITLKDYVKEIMFHINYDPNDASGFYIKVMNYINQEPKIVPGEMIERLHEFMEGAEDVSIPFPNEIRLQKSGEEKDIRESFQIEREIVLGAPPEQSRSKIGLFGGKMKKDKKAKKNIEFEVPDEIEPTVLGDAGMEEAFQPYLIKMDTNTKIMITKNHFKLGRLREYVDCDLSGYRTIGKFHASILLEGTKCFIRDANSVNGTYVDGKRIPSNVNVSLEHGAEIKLANERFVFKKY